MSSINSSYYNYASIFASASGTDYAKYSMNDLLKTYSQSYADNYGTNNTEYTDLQAASIINYKTAAVNVLKSVVNTTAKKNDGSSIFNSLKAVSSDSGALSVSFKSDVGKYSSEALAARRDPNYTPSTPENFDVKISQLAEKQRNTSALNSNEATSLSAGTHRFSISSGESEISYSINVEEGDTNETVQKKIASAINGDEDSKVTASVSNSDGKSYLVIESKQTGISGGFEITDTDGSDVVSQTGVDNVTQAAKDAVYSINNGPEMTSESNEIEIDDRTSITLKKTTDNVSVSYEKDTVPGINAARELVNSFNALYELASDNQENSRSALLLNQLSGLAQTYAGQLSEVGISRDENGYLAIDEDKMKTAAENGKLESLFASDSNGINYGFTSKLSNIAKSVDDNPAQYVGDSGKNENGQTKAQNFWDEFNSGSSSYSKLYFNMQKYENIGVLFNSMF